MDEPMAAIFINLTPHEIKVYQNGRAFPQEYPPSGEVARIGTIDFGIGFIGDTPVAMVEYGRFENPPPKVAGTYYIVSLVTALAIRGRDDILAPYDEIRNDKGVIIGCRSLQRVC